MSSQHCSHISLKDISVERQDEIKKTQTTVSCHLLLCLHGSMGPATLFQVIWKIFLYSYTIAMKYEYKRMQKNTFYHESRKTPHIQFKSHTTCNMF